MLAVAAWKTEACTSCSVEAHVLAWDNNEFDNRMSAKYEIIKGF